MAVMANIQQVKLVINFSPFAVGYVVRFRSLSQAAPLANALRAIANATTHLTKGR
jgi:hypothetical protein